MDRSTTVPVGYGLILAAVAASAMPLLCGCGDSDNTPKGLVAGTVTIDGEPFSAGSIRLISTARVSQAYGAEMQQNGTFEIADNIPTGTYKVVLSPPTVGPVDDGSGNLRPPTAAEMVNNVPPKYQSAETSDQTVDIEEGTNELKLALVSG